MANFRCERLWTPRRSKAPACGQTAPWEHAMECVAVDASLGTAGREVRPSMPIRLVDDRPENSRGIAPRPADRRKSADARRGRRKPLGR